MRVELPDEVRAELDAWREAQRLRDVQSRSERDRIEDRMRVLIVDGACTKAALGHWLNPPDGGSADANVWLHTYRTRGRLDA